MGGASRVKPVTVGLAVCAALALASQARAAPFVYVTDFGDNLVWQFDAPPASSGAVQPLTPQSVQAGGSPFYVVVSPDGRSAYVTNNNNHTVSQYTVGAGGKLSPKTPATVMAGTSPDGLAVSPDGRSIYVADDGDATISQYSIGAGGKLSPKTPSTVTTGDGPEGVAITPNGKSVYVANYNAGTISQYTVGTDGTLSPMTTPTVMSSIGAAAVVVSPNGKSVYVVNRSDDTLWQYSVGAGGELSPKTPATIKTGQGPSGVAITPDGRSVYVTNVGTGTVPGKISLYTVGTGGVLSHKTPATVKTGDEPEGLAVSPDGRSLYVTALFFGQVWQYSIGSGGTLSRKSPESVGASGATGVTVGPDADVSVKLGAPASKKKGSSFTYTVTVHDAGPSAAWLTTLRDKLPPGLKFVSTSTSRGTCANTSGTVSCQLGTLARSATATIGIKVKVTSPAGHSITNRAHATGVTPDPRTSNNSSVANTKVT
jgi:uncharacterized repeat protein (TIGR01451 family)